MHPLLRSLNAAQRRVVRHYRGPLLVSAVAGSGKTTAMCRRIAYLVKVRQVDPHRILATTFTRKAAAHMNAKLKELGVRGARVGTLHSIAYELLRRDGHDERYQGRFKLKKKVILPRGKWLRQRWHVGESDLREFVSWCKNWLLSPKEAALAPPPVKDFYRRLGTLSPPTSTLAALADGYALYERLRKQQRLLTYDDVLYQCWLLLEHNHAARTRWQRHYQYIIIDEVQDTCLAQHEIIRLLAAPRNNLVVVGDVDQSIYSWRAAVPQFMLDFHQQYDASVVYMNQNYRSVPPICTAAVRLIEHNTQRLPARIEATRGTLAQAGVTLTQLRRPKDEAEFIARTLQAGHTQFAWRDMAVLCRTNFTAQSLEPTLLAQHVPYRIISNVSLLDRKIVTTLVEYLRLGRELYADKFDLDAAARTVNTPRRGLGEAYLDKLTELLKTGELAVEDAMLQAATKRQRDQVDNYLDVLHRVATSIRHREAPYTILRWLNEELRLPACFNPDSLARRKGAQRSVDSLLLLAERWRTSRGFLRWFDEALLFDDSLDEEGETTPDKVFISTIHKAKGLEFNLVMVPQMIEGRMPHVMAGSAAPDIEEERRLAYVAVTRAKDRALLSCTDLNPDGKLQYPSRFLTEFGFDPGHPRR